MTVPSTMCRAFRHACDARIPPIMPAGNKKSGSNAHLTEHARAATRTQGGSMKAMMKSGALALATAMLMGLTGCATPPPPGIPEQVDPASGIVALQVVGVQRVSLLNMKWTSITLTEKTTGVPVSIDNSAPPGASYSVFARPVPPGTYSITAFDAPGVVAMGLLPALVMQAMTKDNKQGHEQLGSFTVEAGALTNLGLVVTAEPDGTSKEARVAILASEHGQAAVLDNLDPASRRRVETLRTRGWDLPPDARSADRARDIVRSRSTNLSGIEVTEDGRLMFGTALGLVHVRDAAGRWETLSTGSLDTILVVRPLPQGGILAASDNGNFHIWNPGNRTWKSRKLTDTGHIVAAEPLTGSSMAFVVVGPVAPTANTPPTPRVLIVPSIHEATAAKLALRADDHTATGSIPVRFNGRELMAIVNHAGISRSADLFMIDPSTLQLRKEKLGNWTFGFYSLPDGSVMRQRQNGMSLYYDRSKDGGRTWNLSETSGPMAVRFKSAAVGYGLKFVSMGMKAGTFTLSKTIDGGNTWEALGMPFEGSANGTPMQLQLAGNTVFVYNGRNMVSTTDEGATWHKEWPLASAP